ncbi:30S ribosomal protein S13 [Candidatus Wolfebacteria bacterium]|nr:30S ribosomal protein S13 [Candidatus Wolfebacteria bacterium]
MRLAGINIPDNKKIEIALTYIYGIGRYSALQIVKASKVQPGKRAKDLTTDEINRLKDAITKDHKIEGELRQVIRQNINRLKDIGSFRGSRHTRHLPARGQTSRVNSRTVRGNVRKTVGSGKRKVDLK